MCPTTRGGQLAEGGPGPGPGHQRLSLATWGPLAPARAATSPVAAGGAALLTRLAAPPHQCRPAPLPRVSRPRRQRHRRRIRAWLREDSTMAADEFELGSGAAARRGRRHDGDRQVQVRLEGRHL
jgi:hypothetical protein